MEQARIGVIGGSGVYDMSQLSDVSEVRVDTPFGAPSDAYVVGTLEGQRVAFLPRHGHGHRISPTRLDGRADGYGFKLSGVEYLISISACGSLQPQYQPGDIVDTPTNCSTEPGCVCKLLRRSRCGDRRNCGPCVCGRSFL